MKLSSAFVALTAMGTVDALPHLFPRLFAHKHGHSEIAKREATKTTTIINKLVKIFVDETGRPYSTTTAWETTEVTATAAPSQPKEEAAKPVEAVPVSKAEPTKVASVSSAASLATEPVKNKGLSGSTTAGLDREFPDGKLDCTVFPSEYGAVKVPWITKDGWSGIQLLELQKSGDFAGQYRLANADHVGVCKEGNWCSYSCPVGYSKDQWAVKSQQANGESVGGLLCKNGKLWLTRPEASKKLCQAGSDNTIVENKLAQGVAICRTDYPGTENMVIPTWAGAGSSVTLTVPYQSTSYQWHGNLTSAQYYVNNAGVSVEGGCIWGKEGGSIGNWAPLVFGSSVAPDGMTYSSVFKNPLSPYHANFQVTITTDEGRTCEYKNRQFFRDGVLQTGNLKDGCTQSYYGSAKYTFYSY